MDSIGVKEKAHPSVSKGKALFIPVSAGELVDKITILEIKSERIADSGKLTDVRGPLKQLKAALARAGLDVALCAEHKAKLRGVNERLWQIEDDLRACERAGEFGDRFVSLARSVYRLNDERAAVKREIDMLVGSAMREVKSYEPY